MAMLSFLASSLRLMMQPIVVGQHHDRFAVQIRAEDALTAAIEAVAVDQGDGCFSHAGRADGCCGVPRPRSAARPRR